MKNYVESEPASLRGRKRKTAAGVLIVTAAVLAVMVFFKGYTSAEKKYETEMKKLEEEIERLSDSIAVYEEVSREVDIRVINMEIQDIGELATIEYLYTDAGKFEDYLEIFGKSIPLSVTTKSFIAKWDGSIKAGVDISKVTAEVSETEKEIIIYIPEAKILSHEIDRESIETLDEKNGLFNRLSVEDVRDFDAISKEEMEQRAVENGILDKASGNAKKMIRRLIETDTIKELGYTVTFRLAEMAEE